MASGTLSQSLGGVGVTASGGRPVPHTGTLDAYFARVRLTIGAGHVTKPPAPDPYFSNVTLLMHCDSFRDVISGANASNPSVSGPATVDTATYKFGTGSLKINGGEVFFPDSDKWDFGTGPFTIEFWICPQFATSQRAFISQYSYYASPNPTWMIRTTTGNYLYFSYFDGTTHDSAKALKTLRNATWYAICVERDTSNNLRIYVDGAKFAKTANYNYNLTGNRNPLIIGSARPDIQSFDAFCYFDEIRITKGVARYATDTNYVLQSAPFPDSGPVSHSGVLSKTIDAVAGSSSGLLLHAHHGDLSKAVEQVDISSAATSSAAAVASLTKGLGPIGVEASGAVTTVAFGTGSWTLAPIITKARGRHGLPAKPGSAALFIGA